MVAAIHDVVVDRSSPVPLYFQVAEQLEHAILSGTLLAGDRIANEVVLADQLGLSRPTLRQAIQLLVDKGMLVRRRGVGTQVVHAPIRRSVALTSLNDDLRRAGQHPATLVLSLEALGAAGEPAERLKVATGTPLWCLDRLRSVSGEPLALMRNYVPQDITDLSTVDLAIGGQGRSAVASLSPHPPFKPCVRFSRTRLTDDLLDMVMQPSGSGRCRAVCVVPGRGTRPVSNVPPARPAGCGLGA